VFVTNQELRLAEREIFIKLASPEAAELYHLERLTSILDTPAMAAVRKQFLGIDYEEGSPILLGGEGGMAPGAGGGGGAAIGQDARGGQGGRGGKIIFGGSAGQAPGAGGGGGGGDYVAVEIARDEFQRLRAAGFDHAEFRVGHGGKGGSPGEDTIANFVSATGEVLKSIVAKGGQSGPPGNLLEGGRDVTDSDLKKGLQVSSILLAECAQIRNGLLYLLGAGWEHFEFPSAPFDANWPLACTVSTGQLELDTSLALFVIVSDPTGFQVMKERFMISPAPRAVSRPNILIPIHFTGSTSGVWLIRIVSGRHVLASLPVEIKIREETQQRSLV
jgi:hypothetical protein